MGLNKFLEDLIKTIMNIEKNYDVEYNKMDEIVDHNYNKCKENYLPLEILEKFENVPKTSKAISRFINKYPAFKPLLKIDADDFKYSIKELDEKIKNYEKLIDKLELSIRELKEKKRKLKETEGVSILKKAIKEYEREIKTYKDIIDTYLFLKKLRTFTKKDIEKFVQEYKKYLKDTHERQDLIQIFTKDYRQDLIEVIKALKEIDKSKEEFEKFEELKETADNAMRYKPINPSDGVNVYLSKISLKEGENILKEIKITPQLIRRILRTKIQQIEKEEKLNLRKLAYVYTSPAKLFVKEKKVAKKNAFHFIVDVSSSMGGKKIDTSKSFLLAFAQALNYLIQRQGLQIYTSIVLFNDSFLVLKKLSLSKINTKDIEKIKEGGGTILSNPVQYVSKIINSRSDLRHFVFIITDIELGKEDYETSLRYIRKFPYCFVVCIYDEKPSKYKLPNQITISVDNVEYLPILLIKQINKLKL